MSPPQSDNNTAASPRRRFGKRDRVGLACQRCQKRKQKCDGRKPSCATCTRHQIACSYVEPATPSAAERRLYINALEQRVADLESKLSALGHEAASEDHYAHGPGVVSTEFSNTESLGHASARNSIVADEGNEVVIAVRDLSLSASGHYIGASSNINIARLLGSLVSGDDGKTTLREQQTVENEANLAPKSVHAADSQCRTSIAPPLTSQAAERLMRGWMQHIATRYPILHTPRVHWLYENRAQLRDDYDRCILFLVFAVSGRWLESAGEMGYFFSEDYFNLALSMMDQMLRFQDQRALTYLVLLALYCTRSPRDPGAWTYIGTAMRLCIELGLHRSHQRLDQPILERELTKRRFWTAYFLDRDIAFAIGRPPSLSDRDIDAEYPIDVNEAVDNEATISRIRHQHLAAVDMPSTTLAPFIHRLRLKRLESQIQHEIYRVDTASKSSPLAIDSFIQQLDHWRHSIPSQAFSYVHGTSDSRPYDGAEFYTIHYNRAVRFLLYPQLFQRPVETRWVQLCASACQGVLSDYKRLHLKFSIGFSALSIQSVFCAGLTLIYCAWLAPETILSGTEQSLTDCQLLLYVISERYSSARRYRDTFERLKARALEKTWKKTGSQQEQTTNEMNMLDFAIEQTESWPFDLNDDIERMISEMTNQTVLTTAQFGNDVSSPAFFS